MAVQFTLRELMAKKERQTGQSCTYEAIEQVTGINTSTLSLIANNKIRRLPVDALDSLMEFFDCEPGDFIVRVRETN